MKTFKNIFFFALIATFIFSCTPEQLHDETSNADTEVYGTGDGDNSGTDDDKDGDNGGN
ncbi:hypothetical protein POV27_11825 [Aureisphaera galaxeae]|uniref:hypothetical protein n=1 Tax=Aureisphaera galaxeae TaxID=1538023 RepID=UPI002350736D|nr:hypothetical protein [Aureisphaera galaxeae]MDC8004742.1 hypothetical protein [Aureisphaera galaxeae]